MKIMMNMIVLFLLRIIITTNINRDDYIYMYFSDYITNMALKDKSLQKNNILKICRSKRKDKPIRT